MISFARDRPASTADVPTIVAARIGEMGRVWINSPVEIALVHKRLFGRSFLVARVNNPHHIANEADISKPELFATLHQYAKAGVKDTNMPMSHRLPDAKVSSSHMPRAINPLHQNAATNLTP
jgi:hypothetical protein